MFKQNKYLIHKKYIIEFYILSSLNFLKFVGNYWIGLLPISIVYIIDSEKIIKKFPFMSQYISQAPSLIEIGLFFGFVILVFLVKNFILFLIFF